MRRFRGILVVLVGLALVGCSSSSGGNTASSTPTALPSVTTAAPSATPSASAPPTPLASTSTPAPAQTTPPFTAQGDPCTDPSVGFDGLSGIDFDRHAKFCVGMSFAAASNAMPGPAIDGEAVCPWYALVLTVQDPGLHVAAITRPDNPGDAIYMFLMRWQGDPAALVAMFNDPARGTRTQLIVAGPGGSSMVSDVTSGAVSDMYWGKGIPQGVNGELCNL